MNDKTTVAILAAGLGTRMKSTQAKVLHEAAGDTLLNHVLRAAAHVAAPEQIVVIVGHQAEQVKASVKIAGIRFVEQREQKGTGHALLCAREEVIPEPGSLLILNGDGPLLRPSTLSSLLSLQQSRKGGGCVVTAELTDPTSYGRIVRNTAGDIAAIVEQKSATPDQRQIREVNTGVYLFDSVPFWTHLNELTPDGRTNEFYLTDMVEILTRHGRPIAPFRVADIAEVLGINTRAELAIADRILRERKSNELMLSGVTIENPSSSLIDIDVSVGVDTVIGANVQLRGRTVVGTNCRIGAGSILLDCRVGDNVQILPYVVAENSTIRENSQVGPFTRLRQNADVGPNVHLGNFVELKNTAMGAGAKANHLAYLGDSTVGGATNIGAGTITCNYDGVAKHRTVIDEGVFVGSNSTLVAPLRLGSRSYIAAGSVITDDVEPDALAIGRERQVNKPEWARRRREQAANPKRDGHG
jgi:bifunctional UDP-N-acetylglucosamine pyrophosphorylase/glucosamine-1-phosphate N-acetyltransferase